MDLIYILILSTICYASWRFGQAWISRIERRKANDSFKQRGKRPLYNSNDC